MITQNELYDLSFILVLIRSDITNPNNVIVLDLIISLLKDESKLIENNQLRKTLYPLTQLSEKWEFVKHENYYVRTLIFKDLTVQKEVLKNLTDLKLLLQSEKFEQAYDLVDALHDLPTMIADNKGVIPKNYWKLYIQPYCKKWKKIKYHQSSQ